MQKDTNSGLSFPTGKIWFNDHESAVSPIINFEIIFTLASLLFYWAGASIILLAWLFVQAILMLIFVSCLILNPQLLMSGKIYLALQKIQGIGEKNKKIYTVEEGEIVQPLRDAKTISASAKIVKPREKK